VVVEQLRLVLSQDDHAPRPVGEPFEHETSLLLLSTTSRRQLLPSLLTTGQTNSIHGSPSENMQKPAGRSRAPPALAEGQLAAS
ncbi:MAG: hypothetical protein KDB41_06315, partial [Propionibacteriaceae bacterium]|nr:hypothetical protein [Propionibacteriaceae bacterium]